MVDEFQSYAVATACSFDQLLDSAGLESLGKGRRGAVLVEPDAGGDVPLVRTTTQYAAAPQPFRALHQQLAEQIQRSAACSLTFDNALFEHYTRAYASMGSHSDQALDLAENSLIAVFSCYQRPTGLPSRRLVVQAKTPDASPFDVPLLHHHAVVFSLATNRRFKHKIVPSEGAPDNAWLGLTFRTSKTKLRFVDGQPHFRDGSRLVLADDAQRREFFALRRQENDRLDFSYPPLTYTLSASDLMPPALAPPRSR